MQTDDQGKLALCRNLVQEFQQCARAGGVDRGDWLVGEQSARPLKQCARQGNALLLATGKRVDALEQLVANSKTVEQLKDFFLELAAWHDEIAQCPPKPLARKPTGDYVL